MSTRIPRLLCALLTVVIVFGTVACAQATPEPTKATAWSTPQSGAAPQANLQLPGPTVAPTVAAAAAPKPTVAVGPTAAPAAKPAELSEVRLMYHTSAMGTPAYKGAIGISELIHRADAKLNITVSETAGGMAAQANLANGEADLAALTSDAISAGYNGILDFEGKAQKNLRQLWAAWPTSLVIGVRADVDVKSLRDLEGRIVTAPAGTSAERLAMMAMKALGINPKWQPTGSALVADMIKSRKADAFIKVGGRNDSVTMDLASSVGIRLLDVSQQDFATFDKAYPSLLARGTFPAGSFKGQDKEVGTLLFLITDVATTKMSADTAYRMVKALYQFRAEVPKIQPGMEEYADFPQATMKYANIPLHAGVIKFYKELGLSIPDKLVPSEAK